MPPLPSYPLKYNRILIRTHHMTSRKKILTLTQAAKRLSCSVLLKTGSLPGVMIAESVAGDEGGVEEWVRVVKGLRYKDFRLCRRERGLRRGLDFEPGTVKELTTMKELTAFLQRDEEMLNWWRVGMGYVKDPP